MHRCIFGVTFRSDESKSAMRAYWRDVHAPLVLAVPGLVKHVQCDVVEALSDVPFDGIAELYFADQAAYDAAVASDYWRDVVVADSVNFLDENRTFGAVLTERHLR